MFTEMRRVKIGVLCSKNVNAIFKVKITDPQESLRLEEASRAHVVQPSGAREVDEVIQGSVGLH